MTTNPSHQRSRSKASSLRTSQASFLTVAVQADPLGTGEKTGTYIYIVDGLIVPDTIGRRALVPGRRVAFTEDVIAIATSDEVGEVGIVKSADGNTLVLTKLENAEPGYGRPMGSKDISFTLDADTAFIANAQPSSRSAVLTPGAYVRLMGAAPQTINVIEPVAPIRAFPGAYRNSRFWHDHRIRPGNAHRYCADATPRWQRGRRAGRGSQTRQSR